MGNDVSVTKVKKNKKKRLSRQLLRLLSRLARCFNGVVFAEGYAGTYVGQWPCFNDV